MPEVLPYLFYLYLGESIFVEIAYCTVIYKNCKMLYGIFTDLWKRKIFISHILILHSIVWVIIAITTLVHNSYCLALWRPTRIIYDPKYFYISAMVYFCFMPSAAVSLFFSTIERCFVFVVYNRAKLQKIQKCIFVANLFFVVLVVGLMIEAVLDAYPDPFPVKTPSFSASAISEHNLPELRRNLFRLINSALNLIAVFILTILLRKTKALSKLSNHQRDMALLVQKIILIHTFVDLLVQLLIYSVLWITGISATNYLGVYSRTLSAFDGIMCSGIFVKTIEKIKSRNSTSNNSTSNNQEKWAVMSRKIAVIS